MFCLLYPHLVHSPFLEVCSFLDYQTWSEEPWLDEDLEHKPLVSSNVSLTNKNVQQDSSNTLCVCKVQLYVYMIAWL